MSVIKIIRFNLKVQLVKMWDSHVTWGWQLFFVFFFLLFISFVFCFFNSHFLLYTKILVVLVFIMAMHWFIATNNYCTRLEHDECITIFFRICWHATKSLEHMERQIGYMKSQNFESFFLSRCFNNVYMLSYNIFQALIRGCRSKFWVKKIQTWDKISLYKLK
jgi:hypothetical protein